MARRLYVSLGRLAELPPEELKVEWTRRFGAPAPLLSPELLRISFLSPKIVEAIADGAQPKGLTRRVLLSCDLPIDWAEQERLFGLAA